MSYEAARSTGEEGAPLVFTFHGTGGDETQFHGAAAHFMPGAHVISPRGDVSENGALRYFRRRAEGVYDMEDLAARGTAMAAFMRAEIARLSPPSVLGLGYSNGANIMAAVALEHPDLLDVMVLMHPLIPWQPAPQPGLGGRRILITAGQRDPICPPEATQAFAAYLEDQKADVTLAWHPGGHEIPQSEVEAIHAFLN